MPTGRSLAASAVLLEVGLVVLTVALLSGAEVGVGKLYRVDHGVSKV